MIMVILFIFGLIFGSFINALVWRLHKQETAKSKKAKQKYSLTKGRSQCVNCNHQLSVVDLIPIASWVFLRGKCRYCKKPISVQYPAVELATTVLFAVSYAFWPYTFNPFGIITFIIWLFSLILMVALCVYDFKWMLLPNKMVAVLTVSSFGFAVSRAIAGNNVMLIISSLVASVVFFGIFYVLFIVSGGRWIGGGDVKLAISLGLLVGGITQAVLTIFLASLFGTLYVLPKLVMGKVGAKSKLPFGPLLIMATIFVVLFGKSLIDWYLTNFLKL